jgi:hypothetical protein
MAALVTACGDEPVTTSGPAPATMAQLLGPWSATPYLPPAAVLAAADVACRTGIAPFPKGVALVLVDARGGGLAQAYFAGANGNVASCYDMAIHPNGSIEALGGGSWGSGLGPPLAATEIRLTDQSSSGNPPTSTHLAGPIGRGIVRVQLIRPGDLDVEAAVANGWFAVWVPGDLPRGWNVRGFDSNGEVVATVPGG